MGKGSQDKLSEDEEEVRPARSRGRPVVVEPEPATIEEKAPIEGSEPVEVDPDLAEKADVVEEGSTPADDGELPLEPQDDTQEPPRLSRRRAREVDADPEVVRVRLPHRKHYELFGIAEQLLGASRIKVVCADGKSRMGRVPGKLRKRMWIREGDLVIVRPWEFQDEKADITYRYTKTQASYLSRKGVLPPTLDVF